MKLIIFKTNIKYCLKAFFGKKIKKNRKAKKKLFGFSLPFLAHLRMHRIIEKKIKHERNVLEHHTCAHFFLSPFYTISNRNWFFLFYGNLFAPARILCAFPHTSHIVKWFKLEYIFFFILFGKENDDYTNSFFVLQIFFYVIHLLISLRQW